MADFYSAFSCNSCCAAADFFGAKLSFCCESKQSCCIMGRSRKRCCKKHKKHKKQRARRELPELARELR